MPSDALHREEWVLACIRRWPAETALERPSYGALIEAARSLPDHFAGVIAGDCPTATALVFVANGRICGVRFDPGDRCGRDALAEISRVCHTMIWSVHRAPEDQTGVAAIFASLVGEGGRQLLRIVQPTMSAHLDALAELERDGLACLVIGPDDASRERWVLFSVGRRTSRIAMGDEGEYVEEVGANLLIDAFRRLKEPSRLYRAVPRFFPDALVAAPDAYAPPPPVAPPKPSRTRRPLRIVVPIIAVAAILLVGIGLWRAATESAPAQAPPPPVDAVGAALSPEEAEGRSDREQVAALQREIADLRLQIDSNRRASAHPVRPVAPSGDRRSAVPAPEVAEANREARTHIDSLLSRISYLENAVQRTRGSEMESPVSIVERPSPSVGESSRRADTSATALAEQAVRARAYTETLVDQPPLVVASQRVRYPESARRLGIQGDVLLSVLIGPTGRVEQMIPLRGHELLRRAAMDGVRRWEFRPAVLDGQPVRCWKTIVIAFRN